MTSLTTSTSCVLDASQKAKVIPSYRWVKCQIEHFKMPETKMRHGETVKERRRFVDGIDLLGELKMYLRYIWSNKNKGLEGGAFEWKDPFSKQNYVSKSLNFEIAFVVLALGVSYGNSGLDAWGKQPARNCSHALRRAAGLFRFLRTEFLVEHKIGDLEETPVALSANVLYGMEKMSTAAAQQIALCLYREMKSNKNKSSLATSAKLHMGVAHCLEKAFKALSIVRNNASEDLLKSICKSVRSSSQIFEAVSHGILAQDIASRKIHTGAAIAHANRCCEILCTNEVFSSRHRDVVREFLSDFERHRKKLINENNTIYFSVVPDKVERIAEIVLEYAKPVHPMEHEEEKEEDDKVESSKKNDNESEKIERRISEIIERKDICRIEVANVSWNCATLMFHLTDELCETFSNMSGVPVFQVAWKTVNEKNWHTEGRPLVVCNRGETLVRYTADLLLPDTFYVFRVRAGDQDIEGDDVKMIVKQCESVTSWTPWSKETGAVHTERAPLNAPSSIRVTRICDEMKTTKKKKKKKVIQRSTNSELIKRSNNNNSEVTALKVMWSAFEETTQRSVTRYELQYRYSARAKWVRVRRGLTGDSRSYEIRLNSVARQLITEGGAVFQCRVRAMDERCWGAFSKIATLATAKFGEDEEATLLKRRSSFMGTIISYEDIKWDTPRRKLGAGGFGVVYRSAVNGFRGITIAVKELLRAAGTDAHRDLVREVDILRRMKHPNLIRVFGMCTVKGEGTPAMLMEYMSGGSLSLVVHPPYTSFSLPLPMKETVRRISLLEQVASAMHYLHSAQPCVVHRDLKPGNVLLDKTQKIAKVCDFGLARMRTAAGKATRVAGSFKYMAPELFKHNTVTEHVDTYSFGVVLNETLSGAYPWKDTPDIAIPMRVAVENKRPEIVKEARIHPSLLKLIRNCWKQDPTARPNMDGVLDVLKHCRLSLASGGSSSSSSRRRGDDN